MNIRRMEEKDLDQVSALEADTFSRPWSRSDFAKALTLDYYFFYVAEDNGIILATAGLICSIDEADVTNVAVLPNRRREGIAKHLLSQILVNATERGIKRFTLEVRAGNHLAINLYKKLGFVSVGLRKDFYDLPREDAVIMWKE